jgi:hypothetical protein
MGTVTFTFVKTPGITAPTLPGVGEVTLLRREDRTPYAFKFPAPFDHLCIAEGDPVTPELLRQVADATAYFQR